MIIGYTPVTIGFTPAPEGRPLRDFRASRSIQSAPRRCQPLTRPRPAMVPQGSALRGFIDLASRLRHLLSQPNAAMVPQGSVLRDFIDLASRLRHLLSRQKAAMVPQGSALRGFILSAMMMVTLVGCSGEMEEKEMITLDIFNEVDGWSAGKEVSVNGKTYAFADAVGAEAEVSVSGASRYDIFYPAGAKWDGTCYHAAIPSVQKYAEEGSDPATILACDSFTPGILSFQTSTLKDLSARLSARIYAFGTLTVKSIVLSSESGRNLAGDVLINPAALSVSADGQGYKTVTLECDELKLPTDSVRACEFSFAVYPGDYSDGLTLTVACADGQMFEASLPSCAIESGKTAACGTFYLSDNKLTPLKVARASAVKGGAQNWGVGTAINVNGTVSYAVADSAGVLTFPVHAASSYTAAYPAFESEVEGGSVSFCVHTDQQFNPRSPETDPCLAGMSSGPLLTLSQRDAILRIKIYTVPTVRRVIRSIRVEGEGLVSDYNVNLLSGQTIRTGISSEISVIPPGDLVEGTSLTDDYTSFCLNLAPGKYEGLKMYITAFDDSFRLPEGTTEEDLLVTTTYEIGDVDLTESTVKIVPVAPKVEYHDWIRSNGTAHGGEQAFGTSLHGYINTGWIAPQGSGHKIEYEVTVSGAIYDFRSEKCIFGAQGANKNRPVILLYNKNAKTGWYHTMASVAAGETYDNAEKGTGKCFHIDKSLADKRTIVIGTEGILKQSYVYYKYKNLDRGDSLWTNLYEQSDYFKFTTGSLTCAFPVILFACNKQGTVRGATSEVKIHSFRVTYDDVVERDMWPCTVDGIPGMHDKAHNQFYFNASPSVLVVTKYGCYSPMEVGD